MVSPEMLHHTNQKYSKWPLIGNGGWDFPTSLCGSVGPSFSTLNGVSARASITDLSSSWRTLGFSLSLPTTNKAAVNAGVRNYMGHRFAFLSGGCLRGESLGPAGACCPSYLTLGRTRFLTDALFIPRIPSLPFALCQMRPQRILLPPLNEKQTR